MQRFKRDGADTIPATQFVEPARKCSRTLEFADPEHWPPLQLATPLTHLLTGTSGAGFGGSEQEAMSQS